MGKAFVKELLLVWGEDWVQKCLKEKMFQMAV